MIPVQSHLQTEVPMVDGKPMMLIRMRCPSCHTDIRFLTAIDTPLGALPDICKSAGGRCQCRHRIPNFNNNTSIDETLMSINGVPLRVLKQRGLTVN